MFKAVRKRDICIILAMLLSALALFAWAEPGLSTLDNGAANESDGQWQVTTVDNTTTYVPRANGTNTFTLTADMIKKATVFYAASGDAAATNLTFNLNAAIDNSGAANSTFSFNLFGGGDGTTTAGDAEVTIIGGAGAKILGHPGVQNIYGGGQNSTIGGNTKVTLGGGSEISWTRVFAAGKNNRVGGDSILDVQGAWRVISNDTAFAAGPWVDDAKTGSVAGKAKLIMDNAGAKVNGVFTSGYAVKKDSKIFIGGAELIVRNGAAGAVHGGAYNLGTVVISNDVNIRIESADFWYSGATYVTPGSLALSNDAACNGGRSIILGNASVTIAGGRGLNNVFGAGSIQGCMGYDAIAGNSSITIEGNRGIAALTLIPGFGGAFGEGVYAGGSRVMSMGEAVVSKDATVTLKDITSFNGYRGTISGQGLNVNVDKNGQVNGISDYLGSVKGDSTLVFENVKTKEPLAASIKNFTKIKAARGSDFAIASAVAWKNGNLEIADGSKLTLFGPADFTRAKLIVKDGAKLVISGDLNAGSADISLEGSGSVEVSGKAVGAPKLTVTGTNSINVKAGAGSTMSFTGASVNGRVIERTLSINAEGGYAAARSLRLLPDALTLISGAQTRLNAVIEPADGGIPVTWSVSGAGVAEVSADAAIAHLTAAAEGTAVVTAAADGYTASCVVTVLPVKADRIKLSTTEHALVAGEKFTLQAEVLPEKAKDKEVVWSSGSPGTATVDASGEVTAVAAGTAAITATARDGGAKALCIVTVVPAEISVSSVTVNPSYIKMYVGETKDAKAEIYPANATDRIIAWSADSSSVSVDQTGRITALAAGRATVTAAAGGKSGAVEVITETRAVAASGISISAESLTLYTGQNGAVAASVLPASAADKNISWTLDKNDIIAQAGASDGTYSFTALKVGTVTLTASHGTYSKSCTVTVADRPLETIKAEKFELSAFSVKLGTSSVTKLTAKLTPPSANGTVIWETTSGDIAAVQSSSAGEAVIKAGSKPGIANITATFKGIGKETITAACTVTVEDLTAPVKASVTAEESKTLAANNTVTATTVPTTKQGDIKDEFVETAENGTYVVKEALIKKLSEVNGGAETTAAPAIAAVIPAAAADSPKLAVISLLTTGASLPKAANVGALSIFKLCTDGSFVQFKKAAKVTEMKNGTWLIKKAYDTQVLADDAVIDAAQTYEINIAVVDNDPMYDHDPTPGRIVDPTFFSSVRETPKPPTPDPDPTPNPTPDPQPTPGGSGSSGCSAGAGGIAMLAVAVVAAMRGRKTKR